MDKRLKGQPIQPQILKFIADFTKKNHYGPSKGQAAVYFGKLAIKEGREDYSRQHVYRNIFLLFRKGFLASHVGTEKRSTMLELSKDWKQLLKKHF